MSISSAKKQNGSHLMGDSHLPDNGESEEYGIKEVWADNLEEEMLKISRLLETYQNVSFDTEFPGFIKKNEDGTIDPYKLIKDNVDVLKLIQLGITLSNNAGEMPEPINTWQFNLKFDLRMDKIDPEALDLLKEAGINFSYLQEFGIEPLCLADNLISSGLVINPEIKWVTFHGAFDYAYMVKVLTNQPLPQTTEQFIRLIKQFFPVMYDTKIIANEMDDVKGNSLQKLANSLAISRVGSQHQAGSDAHITLLCYHGLMERCPDKRIPKSFVNRIFGIGKDAYVYRQTNTNFTLDTMNNYMYQNQQFYYPQVFNYNQMPQDPHNNFFMNQMGHDFFYYNSN